MKLFGIMDPHRTHEQLQSLIEEMGDAVNHGAFRMDHVVRDQIGLGHLCSGLINMEKQPIWNDDQSTCIVMAGKIFDYEALRNELAAKGHTFRYPQNDAELMLHSFEEYGGNYAKDCYDHRSQLRLR